MPLVTSARIAAKFCARPTAAIRFASSAAESTPVIRKPIAAAGFASTAPPTIPTLSGKRISPSKSPPSSTDHRLNADDRRIFPTLTVARNLAIAAKKTRFRAWSLKEMFEIFSALEHLMSRESENLSGGEMQMVSISRALLGSPGLVLMDEPSQGLAPKIAQDVMKTVSRLKAEGIAVLLVEQNARSALAVSDRAYVMDHGKVVHQGPAAELLDDAPLRQRLLGV